MDMNNEELYQLDNLYKIYIAYIVMVERQLSDEEFNVIIEPVIEVWRDKGISLTKDEIREYLASRKTQQLSFMAEELYKRISILREGNLTESEIRGSRLEMIQRFIDENQLFFPEDVKKEDYSEYLRVLLEKTDKTHRRTIHTDWGYGEE